MFSAEGRDDAQRATLHGLYWLCANLAAEQPLLVAVDDAHADPAFVAASTRPPRQPAAAKQLLRTAAFAGRADEAEQSAARPAQSRVRSRRGRG